MKKNGIWNKFYECGCSCEGVMLSTEDWNQDKTRQIYLAFFNNTCKFTDNRLGWKEQLRWIWNIVVNKMPFTDTVLLDTRTAKRLGKDLIKFSKGKLAPHIPKPDYLKGIKKIPKKEITQEELEQNLYHYERAL